MRQSRKLKSQKLLKRQKITKIEYRDRFMVYVIHIVRLFFIVYTLMLVIRILGSWFQSFQRTKFFHFISYYTDPYLNIFRRFIPPIGGVMDISPIIGFFVLQFIEYLVIRFLLLFT